MRLGKPLTGDWPVSQYFGERPEYYARWGWAGHPGIDYACPIGTCVLACIDGWCEPKYDPNGWGDYVKVHDNEGEWLILQAHMNQVNVALGQQVQTGDLLGLSGNSGNSTGAHLHWGVQWTKWPNPPYENWLDPFLVRGKLMSKTSAHIQRIESWMQQALVDLGSNWVKIVNPPSGIDPFPRIPNKLVRIHTDAIDDQFVPRGEIGGRDFVRHMLSQWRDRPWATCYSLANEPGCNSPTELDNLNGYSVGAMQEASANGIKLVIFDTPESNPSGGDPYSYEVKRDKLARLVPAVRMATELGHYIGTHAYWRPGVEGPLGEFHALGEVLLKHDIWQLLGAYSAEPQFLVTEWGLDGAIESNPYEGWRAFVARGVITEREYIDGLASAESLARGKPWLKALLTFTWGYEGQWGSYDHDEGFVRNLVQVMANLPGPPVEPPAPPEEPASHPFTSFDRQQAEYQFEIHPATMKAANELGYLWQKEWEFCFFYFCLVYSPADHKYKVLKLDPKTWQVVAQIDL